MRSSANSDSLKVASWIGVETSAKKVFQEGGPSTVPWNTWFVSGRGVDWLPVTMTMDCRGWK